MTLSLLPTEEARLRIDPVPLLETMPTVHLDPILVSVSIVGEDAVVLDDLLGFRIPVVGVRVGADSP
jgi:hypothetical protein